VEDAGHAARRRPRANTRGCFEPCDIEGGLAYVFTSRNESNRVRAKTSRVHDHISVIAIGIVIDKQVEN
jgi:hypothetical protein